MTDKGTPCMEKRVGKRGGEKRGEDRGEEGGRGERKAKSTNREESRDVYDMYTCKSHACVNLIKSHTQPVCVICALPPHTHHSYTTLSSWH